MAGTPTLPHHSPSGRVGLSGPVRVGLIRARKTVNACTGSPSPAASASDPPGGRVLNARRVLRLCFLRLIS